ncbi:HNH endonuclease [Micromonospora chalcea]
MPELSPFERLALYQEWGKRCIWCKSPISFDMFEVEHLVPKSLQGLDLSRTLADYGLPSTFDVHALPNLACSCRPCNGFKGNRPVRGAPIVIAVLDHAAKQAPKIARRASRLLRNSQLSEAIAVIEAIGPEASEKDQNALSDFSARLKVMLQGPKSPKPQIDLGCILVDAPVLKRSKRLKKDSWYSDTERMLQLLRNWAGENPWLAREVVSDTFDASDIRTSRAGPIKVNFLAYAKEMGDYLADVTFKVSYLYITDDVSAMAQDYHNTHLWLTLNPNQDAIVSVVPDLIGTLETCTAYRKTKGR